MSILRSIKLEQRKIKRQISKLEGQLTALGAAAAAFGSIAVKGFSKGFNKQQPRKKRRMSAKGRLAISRATKARWAKLRATKKAEKKMS